MSTGAILIIAILLVGEADKNHTLKNNVSTLSQSMLYTNEDASVAKCYCPPKSERPDWLFEGSLYSLVGGHGGDIITTIHARSNGAEEANIFFRWAQDKTLTLITLKALLTAGEIYAFKKLHQKRPKTATAIVLIASTITWAIVINNTRVNDQVNR